MHSFLFENLIFVFFILKIISFLKINFDYSKYFVIIDKLCFKLIKFLIVEIKLKSFSIFTNRISVLMNFIQVEKLLIPEARKHKQAITFGNAQS